MRFALALALTLLPSLASAQPRGAPARCAEACNRLVTDKRKQALVCGRCLTDSERGAWVVRLADFSPDTEELKPIFNDADWQVRWGAVRALAKVRGFDEQRQLATWVVEGKGQLPCLTLVHLAGSKAKDPSVLLEGTGPMGPTAAAICSRMKEPIRQAMEVEMYSGDAVVQREALQHLQVVMQESPARVVLHAMQTRPPETDDLSAKLLLDDAESKGSAAGGTLLAAAKPDDKARVDRLLAVFSQLLDVQRPKLKAETPEDRREAVHQLALLAPLSERDLEPALDDPDQKVSRAAARGIARGQNKTIPAYVQAKLESKEKLAAALKVKWITFAGMSNDDDCLPVLTRLAEDSKQEETVRTASIAAIGPCAGPKAMPALLPFFDGPGWSRAGAMEALAAVPRSSDAGKWATKGVKDSDPLVQAAAVRSAGPLLLTAQASFIHDLLTLSPHEKVRAAAASSLVELGGNSASGPLCVALKKDPSAEVRQAAAEALGKLGGNEALATLEAAAKGDTNQKVKVVAAASLRKLGFAKDP